MATHSRYENQQVIGDWATAAFGPDEAMNLEQRGIRLLEEAAEAAQSVGVSQAMAIKLMAHVWSRPSGQIEQELGGVGVTVLALAHAAGIDADKAERREIERVTNIPLEYFAQRNREKNRVGLVASSMEVRSDE